MTTNEFTHCGTAADLFILHSELESIGDPWLAAQLSRMLMREIPTGQISTYTNECIAGIIQAREFDTAIFQPGSALDIYAYGLLQETPDTARHILSTICQSLTAVERIEKANREGYRAEYDAYRQANKWQQAGLDLVGKTYTHWLDSFFEGIAVESLVDSLTTGKIKHLYGDSGQYLTLLKEYVRDRLDVDVTMSEQTPSFISTIEQPRWYAPTRERFDEFFEHVLVEVKRSNFENRHVRGPVYSDFAEVLSHLDQALANISPLLTPQHLHAKSYQPLGMDVSRMGGLLSPEQHAAYEKLYSGKNDLLYEIADKHWSQEKEVLIEPGLFDLPPYAKQAFQTSCVASCFRMIFRGLTGDVVLDSEISNSLERYYGTPNIAQGELLKILQTDHFKKAYDVDAEAIEFLGMDLATLKKIALKLKQRHPDYKLYCVLNVETDTATDRNIWHSIVLGEVDEDTVTFHDPSSDMTKGRPHREYDKEFFLQRWAAAYNGGYLVIYKPSTSTGGNLSS